MSARPGEAIAIDIEKPAAGGRMLARHDGQVVLVRGAIPGERVRARVERAGKGVLYAAVEDVIDASPDRRAAPPDPDCGGAVYAHVAYERQRRLKGEILADALARIGRIPRPVPDVIGSPEHGYRMRARFHAMGGRLGFFREGTHDVCDAGATGQLLPATVDWIASVEATLASHSLAGLQTLELAENIDGSERACHLALAPGTDAGPFVQIAEAGPLTGISVERPDRARVDRLLGVPSVGDVLHVARGAVAGSLRLRRDVRAFFQGNRFLIERLVQEVVSRVSNGPVVDLYAGVGLFGLSLAVAGVPDVTLVESDPISSASLADNAEAFGSGVTVHRTSVETYLESGTAGPIGADTTIVLDPPRTGLSKAAVKGIAGARAGRIVYVSCDPATFARDARILLDAGYGLEDLTGIDLFPNTAHVEAVARFDHFHA